MSAVTLVQSPAGGARSAPVERDAAQPRRWFKPGWPLGFLFIGYPLWWVLGIDELVAMVMSVVMASSLLRQPKISVPRGFLLWLLFLIWVVGGVFVLQVTAPGADPTPSSTRYLTWAYRVAWYLACTVVLLYVANFREQLSAQRVCRALGWMFITVTVGGLLGTFLPSVDFPSALELVLPNSIANQSFINAIIHPRFSEVQQVLGHSAPRPSAPFAYTNIWGLNYACLLPFFLRGWLARDAGWRRLVAPLILAVSAIPMIYSLDRGMWLALVGMAVFAAVRAAMIGRPAILLTVAIGAAAAVAVVSLTPLGTIVQQRLSAESSNSNQGRTNLSSLTVRGVATKSPIAGLGSTRNVQGNFNSIAGGATSYCPRCSPPALGTQGQLWLVVYSQGLVGLVLYLAFFLMLFFRYIRSRSPTANVALAVMVAGFITMPVYNSLGLALYEIMVAIALVWRESSPELAIVAPSSAGTALAGIRRVVRRQIAVVVACALLGVLAGAVWQHMAGTPTQASVRVALPTESRVVSKGQGKLTVDTLGQLSSAAAVTAAIAPYRDDAVGLKPLNVQGISNTTIVTLVFTSKNAQQAGAAVQAAATAYLAEVRSLFAARRTAEINALVPRTKAAANAVVEIDGVLSKLAKPGANPALQSQKAHLVLRRQYLANRFRLDQEALLSVEGSAIPQASVITPVRLTPQHDFWNVSLTSGLLLGLLAGILLARERERRGTRLRDPRDVARLTGLNVLAQVREGSPPGWLRRRGSSAGAAAVAGVSGPPAGVEQTAMALSAYHPAAYVAADETDEETRAVADRLDEASNHLGARPPEQPGGAGVVVVVSPRTRSGQVEGVLRRLGAVDARVLGVVFASAGQ